MICPFTLEILVKNNNKNKNKNRTEPKQTKNLKETSIWFQVILLERKLLSTDNRVAAEFVSNSACAMRDCHLLHICHDFLQSWRLSFQGNKKKKDK